MADQQYLDLLNNAIGGTGAQQARTPEETAMLWSAFGNSLQGGTPFFDAVRGMQTQRQQDALNKIKLLEMRQKLQQQQQIGDILSGAGEQSPAQSALAAGQATTGQAGPTLAASQAVGAQTAMSPAKIQAERYRKAAMALAATSPESADKYLAMADRLDPAQEYGQPVNVAGPNGQPMLAQFSKTGQVRQVQGYAPDSITGDIKNYQFAVRQGYPGSFSAWQKDNNKGTTVVLDTNKSLGSTLGTGIGGFINDTFQAAQTAQETLANSANVRKALGNAITGPFADQRAFLSRLQTGLGVAQGDTEDRLADTRRVLSGLAKAELQAARQMKGQGQITESERTILKNAEAGNINLSPSEIRVVLDAMESSANKRISAHNANVARLRRVPGAETVLPFYEMGAQPEQRPPSPGLNDVQSAAQREIERRRGGR